MAPHPACSHFLPEGEGQFPVALTTLAQWEIVKTVTSENPRLTGIGGTTPVVAEELSSTEYEQEVEIQFDSRYALRRTS